MSIGTLKGCVRKAPLRSNPKAETRRPRPESPSASGFGLRISELGLLSALGPRTSDFKATSPLAPSGGGGEGEAAAHQAGG